MNIRHFLPILFLAIVSCNEPEHGALDPETMSKKLFDAIKNDAADKTALLLPDKGTYRKIEEENGHQYTDLNAAYEQFENNANANLTAVRGRVSDWSTATFSRAHYTESKLGKVPTARVTTKFDADGQPRKVEFTAAKFNNRWYYYGDVVWIDKVAD